MLDGFRVEQWLGSGSMGEVYLATQLSMDRGVALKVLPPELVHDPDDVDRFQHEVRMLAKLDHPNIVTAFEAGEDAGHNYLAMSYVDGQSLEDRVQAHGPIPEEEALQIASKVAEALAYAWDRYQLLHRDIKPSNIMIEQDGTVKLMDMGISKSLSDDAAITSPGLVVGTPYYMSPEQARDRQDIDCRADIYSLGATLYHLLTGAPPHEGETSTQVLSRLLTDPIVPPIELNPKLSPPCSDLILAMTAKDVADRPGSWHTLLERLRLALNPPNALAEVGVDEAADEPSPALWPVILLGLVAIVVVAGASLAYWRMLPTIPESPGVGDVPATPPLAANPTEPPPDAVPPTTPPRPPPAVSTIDPGLATQAAAHEGLYQAALAYERQQPTDYSRIIQLFTELQQTAAGTKYGPMATDQIARLKTAKKAAVAQVLQTLRAQAAALEKASKYDEGEALWRDYAGSFAAETNDARQRQAKALGARRRQHLSEARKAKEAADKLLAELIREVAQDLTEMKFDRAKKRVAAARAGDLLTPVSGAVEALSVRVAAVAEMPRVIRQTFQDQVGQEVTIQFASGREKLTIQSVSDKEIKGLKEIRTGPSVGKVGVRFQLDQLTLSERFRRLEAAGVDEHHLMRGLLALKGKRADRANELFAEGGGALGEALEYQVQALSADADAADAADAFERLLSVARLAARGSSDEELLAALGSAGLSKLRAENIRRATASYMERYGKSKVAAKHAALLQAMSVASHVVWPASTRDLLFLWERRNALPRGGLRPAKLKARGKARYGPKGEMLVTDGAFIAEGFDKAILDACKESNQLSLQASISPAEPRQSGPARIISFSTDGGERNFSLCQSYDRLVFRLRTPFTGRNGSPPEPSLFTMNGDGPFHVVVTYQPGVLTCYVDGEQTLKTNRVNGDFSNWTDQHLLFGDEYEDSRDWDGAISGVAIYSRALPPDEAKKSYEQWRRLKPRR